MLRLFVFIAILSGMIAAMVVAGSRGGLRDITSPLPPTLPDMPGVDLIAYADLKGRIGLIRPDGSSDIKISPENGFFGWPTWSPNARKVAFSGIAPISEHDDDTINLYVSELSSEEPRVTFTNKPGMGPILQTMPHYILWSPDSGRLSFMASDPQGLTLFIESFDDKGPDSVVIGSPLYASWSSDSRYMMVHNGAAHFLVDAATGQGVRDTTSRSIKYRAPAWMPDSTRATFLSGPDIGTNSLFTASVESGNGERSLVDEFANTVAFLWSPDGETLAVSQTATLDGLIYEGIELLSKEATPLTMRVDDLVVAFFWSPDSSKLAYVTVAQSRDALRWMMFDVKSGESWPLVDFSPSREQFTIFQFFDQFAYSHAPWSPDSKSLVFAGVLREEGVSASLQQEPASAIYVTDIGKDPFVQRIAEGYLAFWSPR
jgi:Tol biopolymer transport system component